MTDAQYEICRIVTKYRQIRGGLFRPDVSVLQISAERITAQGTTLIAQSEEFSRPSKVDFKKTDYASMERADTQIIGQILADGWEPFGHDQLGHIWFKRRVKNEGTVPEPASEDLLLKYLIALRDLGILTPEEFDAKLPAVLKRL